MATIDETVNGIITDARLFATETYDLSTRLARDANSDAAGSVTYNAPDFFASVNDFPSIGSVTPPGNFTGSFTKPTDDPVRPSFAPVYVPEIPEAPEAPDVLDTSNLFDIERPAFVIPEFQEVSPNVDTNLDIPTSPSLVFPDVPTTQDFEFPEAPSLTLPKFDGTFDAATPNALGDVNEQYIQAFRDTAPQFQAIINDQIDEWLAKFCPEYGGAMARLESKIAAGMDGGTAMSSEVEQAIYDRERYRVEQEYQSAIRDVDRQISTSGYPIPPGVLNELYSQLRSKLAKDSMDAAASTAIERAKMENQHAQFIMQISAQIRQSMVNAMLQHANNLLQTNSQALQYSKDIVQTALDVHNAALERYRIEAQVFQIKAQVYETELKSAMSDLQAYEMELEAAKIRKDIDKQDLDIYVQKINAQKSKIDLYLAELQGVSTEAQIKKLSIDLYGEKVRAHSLLVQAKQAEFGAYEAALRGDQAKVQAYGEEVRAFQARTGVYETQAKIEAAKANLSLEANRNLSIIYESDIKKYLADLDIERVTFTGNLEAYRTAISRYQSDLQAEIDILRANLSQAELELQAQTTKYNGELQEASERARIRLAQLDLRAKTAVSSADTLNTMAAAALGSQNTMVTLAAEESL